MLTFPQSFSIADDVEILGRVNESLLSASYVKALLASSVKVYAKDSTGTGETWTDLSAVASNSGGADTPVFGSAASMSSLDEFYISDSKPLEAIYPNVSTAGVYVGDGIELYDSDNGITANRLLTGLSDGSNGFRNAGFTKISWTSPATEQQAFALSPSSGDANLNTARYWIKIKLKNFTSATTAPILHRIIAEIGDIHQIYSNILALNNGDTAVIPTDLGNVFPLPGDEIVRAIDEKSTAIVAYIYRRIQDPMTIALEYLASDDTWKNFPEVSNATVTNFYLNGPLTATLPPVTAEFAYAHPADWEKNSITLLTSAGSVTITDKYIFRFRLAAVPNYVETPFPLLRFRALQYGSANTSGLTVNEGAVLKSAAFYVAGNASGAGARTVQLVNLTSGESRTLVIPAGTVQGNSIAFQFADLSLLAGHNFGIIPVNGGAAYSNVIMSLEQ